MIDDGKRSKKKIFSKLFHNFFHYLEITKMKRVGVVCIFVAVFLFLFVQKFITSMDSERIIIVYDKI